MAWFPGYFCVQNWFCVLLHYEKEEKEVSVVGCTSEKGKRLGGGGSMSIFSLYV